MRRAQRIMCSTASPPAPSNPQNIAARTRKRSRTSSAGGDGLTVNAAPEAFGDLPSKRPKGGPDARSSCGNPKNARKAADSSKVTRSHFGSLQNAVVLAPFHTLKSHFQTKLLDFYSQEKMKKNDRKSKLAKQQNASFQYDVIELKPLAPSVKKEGRPPKKVKKKSRSASYCQCKNSVSKGRPRSGRKQGRRRKTSDEVLSRGAARFSGRLEAGRKKASPAAVDPRASPPDVAPRLDLYFADDRFLFAEGDPKTPAMSSRSKQDSLETRSNSSSCREGRVEGSFAISSTSFASYLKHFVRDHAEVGRKSVCRPRITPKTTREKFLPKPNADSSRHLIVRLEKKNSDEHIVHFMDREPRTGVIPSVKSSHHLQPLRRQGRAKDRKSEGERGASYYLRSLSSSKKIASEADEEFIPAEPPERPSSLLNELDGNKVSQMEAATQVGGTAPEGDSSTAGVRPKTRQRDSTPNACRTSAHRDGADPPSSPREPLDDPGLPDEVLLPPRIRPISEVENSSNLAQRRPGEGFPGDRSEIDSAELVDGLRFQEFAGSREAQDKESDFIFGPRHPASRLGGSCEFPFGLSSVFPEDED